MKVPWYSFPGSRVVMIFAFSRMLLGALVMKVIPAARKSRKAAMMYAVSGEPVWATIIWDTRGKMKPPIPQAEKTRP
jgi:hypothetical protein